MEAIEPKEGRRQGYFQRGSPPWPLSRGIFFSLTAIYILSAGGSESKNSELWGHQLTSTPTFLAFLPSGKGQGSSCGECGALSLSAPGTEARFPAKSWAAHPPPGPQLTTKASQVGDMTMQLPGGGLPTHSSAEGPLQVETRS